MSGGYVQHDFAPGVYGSEPAFAPRTGAQAGDPDAEDDGYVVTFVTDLEKGTSAALVLNARDFTAPPLAEIELPQRVPAGFHATWMSQA